MTTNLDALFRYEQSPHAFAMQALGKLHDVYGIRRTVLNEREKTIRVEFDFTRLNRAMVEQLLRRAGFDIVEEMSLIPPQPPAPPEGAAPPPAK